MATVSSEIPVFAVENAQFAAGSESPSPCLNDVNEEIDGLQLSGSQGTQIGSSRNVINPSDHGLVLLNQSINQSSNQSIEELFVTVPIHDV